jgi:hypothetical protein
MRTRHRVGAHAGGRFGTSGSARTLIGSEHLPLVGDKQIVLVRHGLTTWNVEKRIQGSSNESTLTEFGREQVREALTFELSLFSFEGFHGI